MSYSVPILLIAFNRPDTTGKVLAVLRALQPESLYVAFDGPRAERPGEAALCAEVRQLVQASVDWPCRLQTLLRATNLGCRAGVSGAIDWFFGQEEEGIILEDDILPDLSFFPYCQELLERFRGDERIGAIGANNHQRQPPTDGSSYRFSIYAHVWGWATWRRAWRHYDADLAGWPVFREQGWLAQLGGASLEQVWGPWLDQLASGKIDTWDMVWQLTCWQQGYLTCLPALELVENIGFRGDATHTIDETSPLWTRGTLTLPLVHPAVIQADRIRDADTFRRLFIRSRRAELVRKGLKALRLLGWR